MGNIHQKTSINHLKIKVNLIFSKKLNVRYSKCMLTKYLDFKKMNKEKLLNPMKKRFTKREYIGKMIMKDRSITIQIRKKIISLLKIIQTRDSLIRKVSRTSCKKKKGQLKMNSTLDLSLEL